MAISVVGGAADAANAAQVTLTLPTLAAGDVVYVFAGHGNNAMPTMNSSGYGSAIATLVGGSLQASCWRKVMGGTPDTTVVIDRTAAGSTALGASCICLRGVDQTTPEDATVTSNTGTSTPNGPSIVTVTNGAYVISATLTNGSAASYPNAPSGYTDKLSDAAPGGTASVGVAHAGKIVATAGSEDPGAWTSGPSARNICFTVAVRPSTGGGGIAGAIVCFIG